MIKKTIKVILSILLSLFFIYILFIILKKIGLFSILEVLRTVNWLYFAISFILVFLSYLIWAKKWQLLIHSLSEINLTKTLVMLFASSFAYATTPGPRLGGEPVRTYYLSKFIRHSKTECFATIHFDRSTETIGLQFLFIFSYLFLIIIEHLNNYARNMLAPIFIFTVIMLTIRMKFMKKPANIEDHSLVKIILQIIYKTSKRIKNKFQYFPSYHLFVKDRINRYKKLYFRFNENKDILNSQIMLGLMKWALTNLSIYMLFLSTGTRAPLLSIIIVQSISVAVASFLFIPGGIGIMESVMIGLYFALGINVSIAATVALLHRAITYFYSIPLGLYSIYILNKKFSTKK